MYEVIDTKGIRVSLTGEVLFYPLGKKLEAKDLKRQSQIDALIADKRLKKIGAKVDAPTENKIMPTGEKKGKTHA